MIETAEAMVKCLEMEGVEVVFGYPGAAICPFYDYIYKSEKIKHILVRQEQNGGHSANGYARVTGKPAVCIATSGPGATNLITAIATAYADSIPLVVITGQVNTDQIGRDVFQEADITGSAEPFVKHSYLVKDATQLPRIMKEAFYIAGTGRNGPVLIDVPMDIQKVMIDFEYPESVDIISYNPTTKGNGLQIKRVVEAIEQSEKPLICVGGGVFSAHAQKEFYEFASTFDIPVVTTMMGIGAIRGEDRLTMGMIGTHGCTLANQTMKDCDLLILIGARVGDRAVTQPNFLAETKKIIHIDIDPAEIGKNIEVNIPLVGDAKKILVKLLDTMKEDGSKKFTAWLDSLNAKKQPLEFTETPKGTINPKLFMKKLSDKAPEDTIVVADVGQNQIWTANGFKVKNGRFLTSGGMGTMGYSVPASIGAKLANPDAPVIAVCGDGSFQMSFMELATAVQHNVGIKVVVMVNNRLGMVCELQHKQYEHREMAVNLDGSPDFVKLAEAYGIPSMRVTDNSQIDDAIDKLFNEQGIFLLECNVAPNEPTL
jgi:acetolactate synthase-1/2/3 large subunit